MGKLTTNHIHRRQRDAHTVQPLESVDKDFLGELVRRLRRFAILDVGVMLAGQGLRRTVNIGNGHSHGASWQVHRSTSAATGEVVTTHLINRLERLPKRPLPNPWSCKVTLPDEIRIAEDEFYRVLHLLLRREVRAADDAAGLDDVEEDLD